MAIRFQVATGTDGAGAVEAMVERLAGSRLASLAAIVALACFLPGFVTLPPLDGDEPATGGAARGMVATGDGATSRVQTDRDRAWRPRGEPWLATVSALLGGREPPVWVYRIPRDSGSLAMLTWWTALALGGLARRCWRGCWWPAAARPAAVSPRLTRRWWPRPHAGALARSG
jgi:4-amino-4-deoxy-L-arabinose transferase-like glycosyltransferase